MKATESTDYHDYVFKDGRLRGDFELMYKNSKEIPWHQDRTAHAVFSNIDIEILKQKKYNRICEIGCGMGFFTRRLHTELNTPTGNHPYVVGYDISPTAIRIAQENNPDILFKVFDVKEKYTGPKFDLVVCKELIWYIFPVLDDFIHNLHEMAEDNSWIYISQSFPEKKEYVGKEVINSPNHLIEILKSSLKLEFFCTEWSYTYHGSIIHILLKKQLIK